MKFLKDIVIKIISDTIIKNSSVIITSIITVIIICFTFVSKFGDYLVARSIQQIVPSHVEITYKNDKIKFILQELHTKCSLQDCFATKINIENKNHGNWVVYYNNFIGWDSRINQSIDIKSIEENPQSALHKKAWFENKRELAINLMEASDSKCAYLTKESLIENGSGDFYYYLDAPSEFEVDEVVACLGYGKGQKPQWITMLGIRKEAVAFCNPCIEQVALANKRIEDVWNK